MGLVNQAILSQDLEKLRSGTGEHAQRARLSDVLFERPGKSFASLATLPSNVEAIEAALMFSGGHHPFAAIVGPSGWGKSHIMEAVYGAVGSQSEESAELSTALEFLLRPYHAEGAGWLLLDEAQEVIGRPRLRSRFRLALERRVRAGRPTLLSFTAMKSSRALRAMLPNGRDWVVATIDAPDPRERVELLDKLAAIEGLALSPTLSHIIAVHMLGNGRTLAGALKRLRVSGSNWMGPNATLRAIGLLDPFFSDNSGWDLRNRIERTAEASRAQFPRLNPRDLALYAMLRRAGLAESEVARAMALSPADAYQRAAKFHQEVEGSPSVACDVDRFVEAVLRNLQTTI